MDWQWMTRGEAAWRDVDVSGAWEARLRPGQPLWIRFPEGWRHGESIWTPEDILRAAQVLSGHSLAAHQKELARGFLPLPGGHRLGVAGWMDEKGLRQVTSLCLRLAHDVPGVGRDVFPHIRDRNTLVIGPPGSGKTTLLRGLVRLYGLAGYQVGVADERWEIAACRDGRPLLDVGPRCDVISGLDKDKALMLLIRALSPDVAAADELGGSGDTLAVREAARCGVRLLATAHGSGPEDIRRRKGMEEAASCFQCFVVLNGPGETPRIYSSGEAEACKSSWL